MSNGPIEDLQDPAKQPELAQANQVAELVAYLSSPSTRERRRAARALGNLGQEAIPALPALIAAFCDREMSVRSEAVAAVSGLGAEAVPALLEALDENAPDLRRVVVVTLGEIGPQASAAVGPLRQALADEWLSGAAAKSLEKITGRKAVGGEDWLERLVPWLLAGWVVLIAAGLLGTVLTWGEMGLFGVGTGAAGSASVLGGVGVAMGALLGWSRGSVRGLLLLPLLLGLGGALAGMLLGGIFGGLIEPIAQVLRRS